MKIAVYGTLREGYGNHRLLHNCTKVDLGWTDEKYQMTASGIPYVHPTKPLHKVRVEVYDVPEQQLPYVDMLEGYDPNNHEGSWYKRSPINVTLDNGQKMEASIYFNEAIGNTLVATGDFKDYAH